MANFEREERLAERLLVRLGIAGATVENPNENALETGVDLKVMFADGSIIGIQITEIDPHAMPGSARRPDSAEKNAVAKVSPDSSYFAWGQNDPSVSLNSISRAIQRKVSIAAKHSFDDYNEVWLLLCTGIPERGVIASTVVMTPWLSADDLNIATGVTLQTSNYDRCFLFSILGAEPAFYPWDRRSGWKKSVLLEDVLHTPREAYVHALQLATSQEERDRLCDEEIRKVLAEMQAQPDNNSQSYDF